MGGFFGCTEALGNGFRIKPGMTAVLGLEGDQSKPVSLKLSPSRILQAGKV